MPSVRIDQKRVWVGAESRPLLHGEVHYWRLSPARWRDVLRSVRGLGIDIVSTYVCWDFHELAPGRYDFRGESDPQRDLVRFIELAAAERFWVVLRPGPYIYAEWRNSGVPDRVVAYHRSDPEFRCEAERYMSAVVNAFAPRLATRGGPVVLVQADNEPDPWSDHYASRLGLADSVGPFHEFLRTRYGEIASLNAAWKADFASFEDARAILAPLSAEHIVRYLDVVRFYHHYTTEVACWTADAYRRMGVDVPIYANAYAGFGVQHWREMEQAVDVVGPDIYPTAEFRAQPHEHRRMLESVRFTRTYSPLPYIPEFEAGIWHGWHARVGVLPANHYRLACLSALLAGVSGWGWYMLVNRDNWSMSPIDELGSPRPGLAAAFADIVRVFHAMDPPSLVKLADTAVAVDVLQRALTFGAAAGEPLLGALYVADVDYEFFDVETGRVAKPLVFYAGSDWLGRSAQERLLAYVEDGGTLVCFQELPQRDERMDPLNVLGLRSPDGVLAAAHPRRLALALDDVRVECSSASFGWFAATPGQAIVAERLAEAPATQQGLQLHSTLQVGERYVVGYRESRGAGSMICLCVAPSPEIVLGLHRWLDIPIPSRASMPSTSTALFRRGDGALFLVAVNNGDEEQEASISLSYTGSAVRHATDLFSGASWPINDQKVIVRLPRKNGIVVRLDPTRQRKPR